MIYSEDKAKQIVDRFGLNPVTMRVWKARGVIPDKYFREDFQPAHKINKEARLKLSRLREILASGVFNIASICRMVLGWIITSCLTLCVTRVILNVMTLRKLSLK